MEMKKQHLIFGAIGVVILGVVFLIISTGSRSKELTVTSDDSKVVLGIPPDALPEGVLISDLAVTRIAGDQLPAVFGTRGDSPDNYVVYDLVPDGLQFNSPVSFTLTSEIVSDDGFASVPLLYLVSGQNDEQIDLVDDTQTVLDPENNTVHISGQVAHFSKWGLRRQGQLWIFVEKNQKFPVGKAVDINGVIREAPAIAYPRETGFEDPYYILHGESVGITHTFVSGEVREIIDPGKLAPDTTFKNKPQDIKVEVDTFIPGFDISDFTCKEKGNTSVEWQLHYVAHAKDGTQYKGGIRSHAGVECTQALSKTSPEPPPPAMVQQAPPYRIMCPDGTVLTGNPKADAAGKPVLDANGNNIDADTGKSVICTGSVPKVTAPGAEIRLEGGILDGDFGF
jgi:hypothetical protein